jgi:tetratricopeptide (TPR) repeat protein
VTHPQSQLPGLQAARERLDRLEAFLAQDAGNGPLRADAFQAALQCGEWDRARDHLDQGRTGHPSDAGWRLREADWLLAQARHAEALALLQVLRADAAPGSALDRAIVQDLGFIAFSQGRPADAVATLRPLAGSEEQAQAGLQQLWLRALHHAGEVEEACAWAAQCEARGQLDAGAAGIAALAAIDAGDFAAAQRWVRSAEAGGASNMETLVARSSVALAVPDPALAHRLAQEATRMNPRDGRAWSAQAFAELLGGELGAARASFRQALSFMPQHIGTWHGQGWTQILQRDLAAARESFAQALALDRNFAESHGGLAVVLALQGDGARAREHIALAQRLERADLSSRYAQAILDGEAQDAQAIQRLAHRLLGARRAPLGGTIGDALPGGRKTLH